MPKISIIIPTYNRADYLKSAIESILLQSYTDFEIVISDNASTDHTEAVIKSFNDARIKYYRNSENLGVVTNHNIAIEKCLGEYIHVFSDDDLMSRDCLEKKAFILDSFETVGLVHSNSVTIDSHSEAIDSSNTDENVYNKMKRSKLIVGLMPKKAIFNTLYYSWNIITMPSVMLRASILKDLGTFSNNMYLYCDWELWLRIATIHDFYYLGDQTVSYRIHNNNIIKKQSFDNSLRELTQMKKNIKSTFQKTDFYIRLISESQNLKYLKGERITFNFLLKTTYKYVLDMFRTVS